MWAMRQTTRCADAAGWSREAQTMSISDTRRRGSGAQNNPNIRAQYPCRDARTGDVLRTYDQPRPSEIDEIVSHARSAASWWAHLGFAQRQRRLLAWKTLIADSVDDLAQIISTETGKPFDDAVLEIILTLGHLDWAAKNARAVLSPRRVPVGLASMNHTAEFGYEPYGVVAVIGPWNYPLYTPMGSISYALAAGNAVIFKPSDLTSGVAVWLAESWLRTNPEYPVLQTVPGDGSVGELLVRSGVDKVAFTGSTTTAKKVMAACAENLTPIVAECGGKDAMIVAADADLDHAADCAVAGGMGNSGQTCVGVERVYVDHRVASRFLEILDQKLARLRLGPRDDASYGPMTLSRQVDIVREHVKDALDRGGVAYRGGLDSIRPPYVEPILLVDVPEESAAVQEETFGPTLVVNRVRTLDDAVARANATPYGLGASVFSGNLRTAKRLATRLRAGVVTINSILAFAGIAELPFGGVRGSGFGRIHGRFGLREFSIPKSIKVQRFALPLNLLSMERTERDMAIARKILAFTHGSRRD